MIELNYSDQKLQNAIERARANRTTLLIQRTSVPRKYVCVNKINGNRYLTSFYRENGKRYGTCNCKAGKLNIICKHIAAAAGLNMCLAEQGLLEKTVVNTL